MRTCSGILRGSIPEKCLRNIFYSDELSHKIYASVDAFLMPSLFEPCGLQPVDEPPLRNDPDRPVRPED